VAEDGADTLTTLLALLETHAAGGRQIHDAQLVATMMNARIERLLTFNPGDFERFRAVIRILQP